MATAPARRRTLGIPLLRFGPLLGGSIIFGVSIARVASSVGPEKRQPSLSRIRRA
jgi:hypothetical protein